MDSDAIEYKDIFVPYRMIDKSKLIAVRLSRYKAWLFRTKLHLMVHARDKDTVVAKVLDTLKFFLVTTAIIITCPRVMALSDYFDFDTEALNRIDFDDDSDEVILRFHPKLDSDPNRTTVS